MLHGGPAYREMRELLHAVKEAVRPLKEGAEDILKDDESR